MLQERVQNRTEEQNVAIPVPQNLDKIGDVKRTIPQEQVQHRKVEQKINCVDVPMPMSVESLDIMMPDTMSDMRSVESDASEEMLNQRLKVLEAMSRDSVACPHPEQ